MNTREIANTLATLFDELVDGPAQEAAYMLNAGDIGLLRTLDRLTAREASAASATGASIAAHVDHLRYGLSLMNQWSSGEDPFAGADWSASWRRTTVSDAEWEGLRNELCRETRRWREVLRAPREVNATELNSIVGAIAHLAYHLGAIRQMNLNARGPAERTSG